MNDPETLYASAPDFLLLDLIYFALCFLKNTSDGCFLIFSLFQCFQYPQYSVL